MTEGGYEADVRESVTVKKLTVVVYNLKMTMKLKLKLICRITMRSVLVSRTRESCILK